MPSAAIRRFWVILWAFAAGLILLLFFATFRERSVSPDALRYFHLDALLQGRQFSREICLASTLRNLISLAVLLGLCFHPMGAGLMRRLERMGRGRLWLGLFAVCVGVTILTTVVELPFSYYLGYWHEKAYGLTRQTPMGWFSDYLISMGMDLGDTLFLWFLTYLMIRRWPRRWWIPAAGLNLVLSGLLTVLAPILFLPLEGEVVPLRDPQVLAMVQRLADRANIQVDTVQELLVSKKTSRVNAMVTGLGPTKRVVVYDTLLQQFPPAEVEVVMAHELGHAVNRDVAKGWLMHGAVNALILCLIAWVLQRMVDVGPLKLPVPHAARGMAMVILVSSLTGVLTSPLNNAISRRMEVRADRFALTLTENPAAFITGFRKLASGNPGDVDPPALVEMLSHSHPSVMNRIRAAEQLLP